MPREASMKCKSTHPSQETLESPSQINAASSITNMSMSIPYLPPEMHRIIAQHLHRCDLPNYRLASKALAAFGAEELFRTVTFHYSSASLARLTSIRETKHLQKHVKVLIWDTNLWGILDVKDLHEWEYYFSRKAEYFNMRVRKWKKRRREYIHAAKLAQIAGDRQQWEEYLGHCEDERHASRVDWFSRPHFLDFENMKKICIVNGALVPDHRGIKKIGLDVLLSKEDPAVLARGEGVYMDGPHQSVYRRPGVHAFEIIRGLPGFCLQKLRCNSLCWQAFSQELDSVGTFSSLTSLHLQLAVRSECVDTRDERFESFDRFDLARPSLDNGYLTDFLTWLPHPESLELDVECDFDDDPGYVFEADFTIDTLFPTDHVWPKLRKLALRYFGTTPDALLSLVKRHSTTLKDLRLHEIRMETSDLGGLNWCQVLRKISESVRLERATLSGQLWGDIDTVSLNCDNEDTQLLLRSILFRENSVPLLPRILEQYKHIQGAF